MRQTDTATAPAQNVQTKTDEVINTSSKHDLLTLIGTDAVMALMHRSANYVKENAPDISEAHKAFLISEAATIEKEVIRSVKALKGQFEPQKTIYTDLVKNYGVLQQKAIENMFKKWNMQSICSLFNGVIEMLSKLEIKQGEYTWLDFQGEITDFLGMYTNALLINEAKNYLES